MLKTVFRSIESISELVDRFFDQNVSPKGRVFHSQELPKSRELGVRPPFWPLGPHRRHFVPTSGSIWPLGAPIWIPFKPFGGPFGRLWGTTHTSTVMHPVLFVTWLLYRSVDSHRRIPHDSPTTSTVASLMPLARSATGETSRRKFRFVFGSPSP